MKALILAAGKGERFAGDRPKVLERVLGLTLIERAILSAREAGIEDFLIVIGYRGDEVRTSLERVRLWVRLDFIRNERWEAGNGYSVLAARGSLKNERFVLMMGDHLFDPDILRRLCETEHEGCVACVDSSPSALYDSEATRVLVENGKLIEIGKGLDRFTGVDCGIFLCTDEIFDACKKSIARGRNELSDAFGLLAERGSVKALEIGGKFWFDLDYPEDLDEAKRRMLDSLPSPQDGIVSRHLNRKVSTRISSRLAERDVSPNALTCIAFLLGALTACLFAFGSYPALALGGILAQLSSIVDGCDGEVARLKYLRTGYGAWLDSVLDRYVDALLILGLALGYWRVVGDGPIFLLGLLALTGSFGISYTRARYEGAFAVPAPTGLEIPVKRDGRLFIIIVGALLNQVVATLSVLAILTNAEVARRLVSWRAGPSPIR